MKEQKFIDFVKKQLINGELNFFQYSFRPKAQNHGTVELPEEELLQYFPDNIAGFTSLEQAFLLEPIKLAYDLGEGYKIIYELDHAIDMDWLLMPKVIQVGIEYKGVSFKLYEFIFGYAYATHYSEPKRFASFQKAKAAGNVHYYLGAYLGISEVLNELSWASNFVPAEFVNMQVQHLVRHGKNANPKEIVNLFIKDGRLKVSPLFSSTMKFNGYGNKIDLRIGLDFHAVDFLTDYPLATHFHLPSNINDITLNVLGIADKIDFFKDNKEFLLQAENLEVDSKLFKRMKTEQLNELAAKYCILCFDDNQYKGVVVGNMMACKLLSEHILKANKTISFGNGKNQIKLQPTEFLDKLLITEINEETMQLLLKAQGKKVGYTHWYKDELEGSLFKVPVPSLEKEQA